MPKDFNNCVSNGGSVKTMTLPGNKYKHICTINGETFHGEIKTKKAKPKKKKRNKRW